MYTKYRKFNSFEILPPLMQEIFFSTWAWLKLPYWIDWTFYLKLIQNENLFSYQFNCGWKSYHFIIYTDYKLHTEGLKEIYPNNPFIVHTKFILADNSIMYTFKHNFDQTKKLHFNSIVRAKSELRNIENIFFIQLINFFPEF